MLRLQVSGMSCAGCEAAVREALQGSDPLAEVKIDLTTGWVEMKSAVAAKEARAAVRQAGYVVKQVEESGI